MIGTGQNSASSALRSFVERRVVERASGYIAARRVKELLLNWFRVRGEISAGIVEGMNNKAKLTMRKAYGFRTYEAIETALYHQLGHLPEPESTHKFC